MSSSRSILPGVLGEMYDKGIRQPIGKVIESVLPFNPDRIQREIISLYHDDGGMDEKKEEELLLKCSELLKHCVIPAHDASKFNLDQLKAIYALKNIIQKHPDIYVWLSCKNDSDSKDAKFFDVLEDIRKAFLVVLNKDPLPNSTENSAPEAVSSTTLQLLESHSEGYQFLFRPTYENPTENDINQSLEELVPKLPGEQTNYAANLLQFLTKLKEKNPNTDRNDPIIVQKKAFKDLVNGLDNPQSSPICLFYLANFPFKSMSCSVLNGSTTQQYCKSLQNILTWDNRFDSVNREQLRKAVLGIHEPLTKLISSSDSKSTDGFGKEKEIVEEILHKLKQLSVQKLELEEKSFTQPNITTDMCDSNVCQ